MMASRVRSETPTERLRASLERQLSGDPGAGPVSVAVTLAPSLERGEHVLRVERLDHEPPWGVFITVPTDWLEEDAADPQRWRGIVQEFLAQILEAWWYDHPPADSGGER